MKELVINKGMYVLRGIREAKKEHHLLGLLMVAWVLVTLFFSSPGMAEGINGSVPLMVVLGLICFLLVLELCWWLLTRFFVRMGLMPLNEVVLKFNGLEEWQQLSFVLGCFALLLLAAVVSIVNF